MTVLRAYDPVECDEIGIPLDWENCRTCGGEGMFEASDPIGAALSEGRRCSTCGGHGSLKAAALAGALKGDVLGLGWCSGDLRDLPMLRQGAVREARCEGCGHPMSDGTWQHELDPRAWPDWIGSTMVAAEAMLREGREPWPDGASFVDADTERGRGVLGVHWSPCEEGCRHSGPGRVREAESGMLLPQDELATAIALLRDPGYPRRRVLSSVEASWRAVDVRTLGWPHDLRVEKLAALCLRCWAERGAA